MAKRKGGVRRKTRQLMKKHFKTKGKISISKFFKEFKIGEEVILKAEPAYQRGMFHLRFHSKQGKVLSKRGACYEVQFLDGGKTKTEYVHPIHLQGVVQDSSKTFVQNVKTAHDKAEHDKFSGALKGAPNKSSAKVQK